MLSYFFESAGEQTVQVFFQNASGQTVSSSSKTFTVQAGVLQTAEVTAVVNDALDPAVQINSDGLTINRRPLIKVKASAALGNAFSISLFNGTKDVEILCDASSTDQQNWELRPKQDLPLGSYNLKAAVRRMDSVLGTLGAEWNLGIGVYDNGIYQAASVGANAHIGQIMLQAASLANLQSVEATIEPKPATFSAPVKITWNKAALQSRNLITSNTVKIPVFGLYANYANQLSVKLTFASGNPLTLRPLTINTPAGPTPMIGNVTVTTARTASSGALGYDFIMSRGFAKGSPVILDTDGNIRWTYTYAVDAVIPGELSPESSAWYDNGFLIGDSKSLNMVRMNLDGSTQKLPVDNYKKNLGASNFHHNMEKGKTGYLGLYDRDYDYPPTESDITFTRAIDSDVVEFEPLTGDIRKTWDLKKILSDYMTSQGDTSTLMFNAESWFHANAAAYDASDDTIVVSSRQNFLIKLKYDTGEIVWIFGDPRKYWYTIPSLRAKALTLDAGGTYPLGQHAVSIPSAGKIMVFNNGNISRNGHKLGAAEEPPNPLLSLVSYYTVNAVAKTAVQDWQYKHPEGLYSQVCSSAYMAPDQSLLVLYAIPQRVVGLDASKNIVFDFAYSDTRRCSAFNATPVPFGNLNFTR